MSDPVIDLEPLSKPARAAAAALFGHMPPNGERKVTLGTPERLTPAAKAALAELEAAGVVRRDAYGERGVSWTPLVDCSPAWDWALENEDDPAVDIAVVHSPGSNDALHVEGDLPLTIHGDPIAATALLDAAMTARFERDQTAAILHRAHEIILYADELIASAHLQASDPDHPYFKARTALGEEVKQLPSKAASILKAFRGDPDGT